MTAPVSSAVAEAITYPHRHLLGIEGLSPDEITLLLDLAESYIALNRRADKKKDLLRGRTLINMFFESSTRTRTSFELAGKRLGADVINMSTSSSSIKKGETLLDTAMTLNAMKPDVMVVRHNESGAVNLLSRKAPERPVVMQPRAPRRVKPDNPHAWKVKQALARGIQRRLQTPPRRDESDPQIEHRHVVIASDDQVRRRQP